MNNVGKIKKVPLREIWAKEDKDFTKWLENNIDYLNEVLNFDINIESSEKNVGPYRVDLYGEDNYGNKVIIENQLEKTDHKHLGQIITYITNIGANTAIWITSDPSEEHEKAIEWLNEISPDNISFYLVKIEAIRIEPQPVAAPLFTIIKAPTEETKQIGKEKKEYAERHVLRRAFWTQLLEASKGKTTLFSNISPNIYHWIGTGAGKTGMSHNLVITNKYASCELYMDRGKDFVEPNINKMRFDKLYKNKDKIDKNFDDKLIWERLDNRRASRISIKFTEHGLQDKDKWPEIQERMIETIDKMEKVFKPYINNLK